RAPARPQNPARGLHRRTSGESARAQAHRRDLRLDQDHRVLPQDAIPRSGADPRPRTVRGGDVESGADGKTPGQWTTGSSAGLRPAGAAVCPHTAIKPQNIVGRAKSVAANYRSNAN